MAEALGAWALWWLGGLQLLVAWWWWKGPSLPRTRFWGASLFALNGFSTLVEGMKTLGITTALDAVSGAANRWTDLFLLGIGLASLHLQGRQRLAERALLGVSTVALILVTPVRMELGWGISNLPGMHLANEGVLILAIFASVAGLAYHLSTEDRPHSTAWIAILGVLTLRYAELTVRYWIPGFLEQGLSGGLESLTIRGLHVLNFVAIVAVFTWLLIERRRTRDPSRAAITEAGAGMILGGFLIGVARGDILTWLAVGFTFIAVRPLVFLSVHTKLRDDAWFGGDQWRRLGVLAALMVLSSGVVGLASIVWGIEPPRAVLFGAGAVVIAAPAAARLATQFLSGTPSDESPREEPQDAPAWPLETDRVTLPADWQMKVQQDYQAFEELPPPVREQLSELTRWQRILLALDGIPPDAAENVYDRTTPGLHFRTHCPYSNIGPEIRRTNERWEAILEELEVPPPRSVPNTSESLVRDTWGRAEGLESGRVKRYELTQLGSQVAKALRKEIGLGDEDAGRVARVVAEGFHDAT